jgi:hypothetical protein
LLIVGFQSKKTSSTFSWQAQNIKTVTDFELIYLFLEVRLYGTVMASAEGSFFF